MLTGAVVAVGISTEQHFVRSFRARRYVNPVGNAACSPMGMTGHEERRMQTSANSNCTVLVVDDDADFNSALRDTLSDVGFNVLTSNSGLKGLEMLRTSSTNINVVLLDYSMPTLDGTQTLQHLNDQFPNVKTIGVTGLSASELSDTYRNGVEQVLLKPIKTSDLVTAIQTVVGIPVNANTAARRTYWIRFGLGYALFVICSYEFLRILGQMVNLMLSSR
jgi:CheY-like chemotaxis protein